MRKREIRERMDPGIRNAYTSIGNNEEGFISEHFEISVGNH
jgi:hypothetical protein